MSYMVLDTNFMPSAWSEKRSKTLRVISIVPILQKHPLKWYSQYRYLSKSNDKIPDGCPSNLFEILARCLNTGNVSFPSILTKGEQSHSAKNKHHYLSLLPQFRQREPRTSTMEVKCLLYLPRRCTAAISLSITIPGSENTGSHYRTKGSLID